MSNTLFATQIGGHARQQTDDAFGSDDRPGRIPMQEVVVLEPLAFSVPDVSLDSRPMAGNTDWNPSEHAVPKKIRLVDPWRV